MLRRGIVKPLKSLAQRVGILKTNKTDARKGSTKELQAPDLQGRDLIDARVASKAYDSEGERKDIESDHGTYKYDPSLSDKRTAVWHNKKAGKTRLGLRGTADLRDGVTDIGIIKGTAENSTLFKKDLTDYEKIRKKYGDNIRVSGHSLGGARTRSLVRIKGNKNKKLSGAGFNTGEGVNLKGGVHKLACKLPKSMRPRYCTTFNSHHIRGDPLSVAHRAFGYGEQKAYKKVSRLGSLKNHDMDNFLPASERKK